MWKSLTNQRGYSLIEIIMVIIIVAIAIPPLLSLLSSVLVDSHDSEVLTQAVTFAQEKMEEIIADKKADDGGRGYDWVVTPGRYPSDEPATGYTRSVHIDTTNKKYDNVRYALVEVTVTHADMPDVVLTTWLTKY